MSATGAIDPIHVLDYWNVFIYKLLRENVSVPFWLDLFITNLLAFTKHRILTS